MVAPDLKHFIQYTKEIYRTVRSVKVRKVLAEDWALWHIKPI